MNLVEQVAALIEGKTVSVDVSTGDHDAGNRLFCTVAEVMEDGDGFVILAVDPEPNFEVSPLDSTSAAHLTIPGALEWDGDNGTHGVVGTHSADGESRAHSDSKQEPTPIGEGMARLLHAYDLGEFADEGGSATVEAMSCESFDNSERSDLEFESYAAGYQRALYEQGAPLLHEVGRLKSFRLSYMEWSDKTDRVQKSAKSHELGKHRADVITERFSSLNDQLANTEQSRRSFFDLSQDLEKRLAERGDPCSWSDAQILEFLGVALRNVDVLGTVHLKEIRQGFEYMRDLNRKALAASAEPAKQKTCIECDQPYCHGVCVERGDQDYDRDQAAKGGDDE